MIKLNQEEFPLVSIIIPCFNHEKYIEECLESIKKDSYPNIEVLIMDDGSVDKTLEVANKWRLENNSCFKSFSLGSQENRGLAVTINDLIKNSLGKFIIPLASDDKLIPGALMERVNYCKEKSKCLALISDCKIIDENSKEISPSGLFDFRKSDKYAYCSHKKIANELLMNWVLPGPVVIFKREIFFGEHSLGLYTETGATEDREIFLRIILEDAFDFLPIKVSEYRIHSSNSCRPISKVHKAMHYKMRLKAEILHLNSFNGVQKIFLTLSCLRYKILINRLEKNKKELFPLEIMIGGFMRSIYHIYRINNYLSYYFHKILK
ncbi:glycosyltransferase [Polynucleobacter sp. JS-Polo-80-F4]|uniref:glycosyltransferase n=1 Tax=Polynucleobacter sp. JS-Polo-80-F4 TaxID=2576918 RepID=UPI001C0B2B33|nr:glycosyltransferase [Polynucleobacter sp. JS-Polo-80-F4]MBU3616744.1 glycosyltransferase [Polynucleobacter sp. JS-Polo-80-F4]